MRRGGSTRAPATAGRGLPTRWAVLAAALSLTIAATVSVGVAARSRDAVRFENAIQGATDRVISRLDIYISTLRGAASLFDAADSVDAALFARYSARLDVQWWYPGIQGIGWTVRTAANLPAEPDERHAIRFLEPLDERNRLAIGFDMYAEPVRRKAMQRARDLAEPALSGRVTLIQEDAAGTDGPQPGFLIYVPVYRGGGAPPTVGERQAALRGFVYAPFRARDLFSGIFGTELEPRVDISVYDGRAVLDENLLYTSGRPPDHVPARTFAATLLIAGHPWTVVYESRPEFEAGSFRRFAPVVFVAGLLVSLWLFWLATAQSRARQAAEAGNSAKSMFLATMSHELRTPLNAIGGYVDLMLVGIAGPITAQQEQYLHRVQRAQQHLLGLINNVLNFAKLDSGHVTFAREPVCVAEAVADAAALMMQQAEHKAVAFGVDGGPDVTVLADTEKLRQVLLNLYSNAIKFTAPGGSIRTSWRTAGDTVEIEVVDTGIGIESSRLEHIFEPFLQVDPDLTRQQQGTGLGLSISRELARGMEGDLRVQSEVGRGSTFTVVLAGGQGPAKAPATRPALA